MRKIKFIILSLICLLAINAPLSVVAAVKEDEKTKSFEHVNSDGSKETITVLQDDENKRVVESLKEDGSKEVVTFDKKTNIIITEENSKKTQVIDLGQQMELIQEQRNEQMTLDNQMGIMVTGDSYEHTWLNYEYDIWNKSAGEFWRVTRPNGGSLVKTFYKETYKNPYNKDLLDDYQDIVIDINGWEAGAGVLLIAGSGLLIAASIATAGVASAAFWAGLGFFGGDVAALVTVDNLCRKAEVIYGKI